MTFLQFINLQLKSKIRSVSLGRDLVAGIFLLIIGLFLLGYVILISVSLPFIIRSFLGVDDAIGFLNSYILFFFATEFLYRFFLQKLPVAELQHYLHLPIPRWKIVHFLLQRSFISLLNIIAILLLVPFTIIEVAGHYGALSAISWLGTIVLISWSVHWVTLVFKRGIGDRVIGYLVMLTVYLLSFGAQYYGWYSIGEWVKPFFDLAIHSPFPMGLSMMLLAGSYYGAYQYYRKRAYEEDIEEKGSNFVENSQIDFLSRFGTAGAFADMEWKLILRHKKSRSYLYISALFLLYALLFYPTFEIAESSFDQHFSLFIGLFITGSFLFNYGQFNLSWNSANFDYYLIQKNGIESYIQGKAILFVAISLICYLLSIPYIYYGWPIFFIHTAAFIFNIGVSIHLLTLISFWKPKPMDINKGAMFNYEGLGAAQFLMVLPMIGIPYIIYLPFALSVGYEVGLAVLSIIGLVGIIYFKKITRFLIGRLYKNRHEISSSFRQEL